MIGSVVSIYAFVVFAILVYKMWLAIPPTVARTTPGKAVGFLFIPVFNLYWFFQALWGWSQDWNSYAGQSGRALPRTSGALPLSIAMFSAFGGTIGTIAALGGNHWVGTVLAAPNYVLIPIFILQVCNILRAYPKTPFVGM